MNALVCLCCLFSMLAVVLILTWGEPKPEHRWEGPPNIRTEDDPDFVDYADLWIWERQ